MKTTNYFKNKKLVITVFSFVLLIAVALGALFGAKSVAAKSTDYISNSIIESLSTDEVEIKNDLFEIYGNCALTDKEFRDKVYEGSPKIYLHYRTDRNFDLPYDALLKVKTASKVYSYEFVEKEKSDAASILNGIKTFINKYSDILNANNFLKSNAVKAASDVPTTFIDCVLEKEYVNRFSDRGYIVYHIAISEYKVDSESILYIVTVRNSFTPGIVAQYNGESGYGAYKNYRGFVHMSVEQAYDANESYYGDPRRGSVPYKKDYWPINQPSVVTITSSVQQGKTLGYSTKLGFSSEGLSIGGGVSGEYSISYAYSKAITKTEPALSAQLNSSDTKICQ
ncbi:MAG: hypothetical protein HFK05_03920 [Clostridia bacterium]|nr:hypothetical protein [Clostridia bacterium]